MRMFIYICAHMRSPFYLKICSQMALLIHFPTFPTKVYALKTLGVSVIYICAKNFLNINILWITQWKNAIFWALKELVTNQVHKMQSWAINKLFYLHCLNMIMRQYKKLKIITSSEATCWIWLWLNFNKLDA